MTVGIEPSETSLGAAPLQIEVGEQVAGLDPEVLVERFGSPLFVYDLDVVTARVAALRASLPPTTDIAFAVKANPSLAIVAHLARLGVGADVASGGELALVLAAGVDPRRIVFTGPAKTDVELRQALEARVGALTIESLQELDRVADLARAQGEATTRQGVMLRLAVAGDQENRQIIGDGGIGKFGLTADELDRAAALLARLPELEFRGIHAFGASNVLDASVLARHVRETVGVAAAVAARHGLAVAQVDVGGGLGISYSDAETPLDVNRLGWLVGEAIDSWAAVPELRGMRLLFEPGRYLVGPAGTYLTRVVATKERGDRTVALVDGGIHHLLRPALVDQPHRIRLVGRAARQLGTPDRAVVHATVAGPLCTGRDILAADVELPQPRPADLLAVLDAGAYGYTESMPFFLSHPVPAEVAVLDGDARLIRPRLEPSQILSSQRLPW